MRRLGHLPVKIWLALALIVLGGATLRLYHLGSESLWSDELESWRQSHFNTIGEVLDYGVRPDTHPPAFQIILYVVEHSLGDSEQALRLPSAIFGILSILAIFWIGTRWFSYREGLISALLMAVLWCPIYFSQEARNYALVLLAALIASAFWAEVASSVQHDLSIGIGPAVGYVLSALLACYSHYYGLLLVALQCAGLLLLTAGKSRHLRVVAFLFLGIIVGYLPWIPSMLAQLSHSSLISWMRPPKVTAFPAFISFLFNRWQVLGAVVLLLYAYLFIWKLRRHAQTPSEGFAGLLTSSEFVLGYWLVIPLGLTWLFSVLQDPIYTQRNLIISMPAAYLLLSRAIVQLPFRGWARAGIVLLIAGSALYQMLFVTGYYLFPSKEQFREAVAYIIDHSDPQRSYAVIGYAYYPDYFNYYFERFGSPERVELIAGTMADKAALDNYLRLHPAERIWYVAAHKIPESAFIEHLTATLDLADTKKFMGAQVWLFRESLRGQ
jgi:mannosyltransferase